MAGMLDRQQLEAFAAVIEHKSFERASVELNITRGAVSQRIKALEQSLATILVVRERPIAPTAAGTAILHHVRALRLLEREVLAALPARRQGLPHIALGVNADSLATWFEPLMWKLMRDQSICIEVVVDDQDHTLELLARGDVIGCISTVSQALEGFHAEALGAMAYRCVASQGFAQQHFAEGFTLGALLSAPAVLFNRKDALHGECLEALFGVAVDRYPRHYIPSSYSLAEAVRKGVGYAVVPASQVDADIAAGELVDLAPKHARDVDLYWHHWALQPAIGAAITTTIVDEARKELRSGRRSSR
jgi:LysR family transcriptional regulator (chromosome initiation inhibitor)